MDHISRIGLFLEVAKQQSFAKAAKSLGITGPAVSKQVQALEKQLGVRLLNRTTRQVTLTEEGAIYSVAARKALEDLLETERLLQEMKASPTGLLKISAPMSFGRNYLSEPISSFARTYPDVIMEVDYDDQHVDMISEGYDVVIRIGVLEDSTLISRKLARCPHVMCYSQAFINQHGVISHPDDLSSHPALFYSKRGLTQHWRYIDTDGNNGSVTLKRQFTANSAEIMLQACIQGVGIALLPIFIAAEAIAAGDIKEIFPGYRTVPERGIYVLIPQNRYLSTKVRLLIDTLTRHCKTLPWS